MVFLPQVFGPTGLLSGFFLNPQSLLLALSFLVPLILLYLIRPKPVNVAVPSLMFILKDMGKSNMHRFFRTLLKDILFLIQLLVIVLLALAIAKPFINVSQESLLSQSIVILDASASTSAQDRFDEIQDLAIEGLGRENIVILSSASPVALDDGGEIRLSAGAAKDLIQDAEPTDTQGNLPSALDLAAQYAGPESRVIVASDFVLSSLEDPDLVEAKLKVLQSKGALVELRTVEARGENIGIVDAQLDANEALLVLKIQNFNERPEEFGLEHNGESVALPQNVLARAGQPGSLLSINVPLGNGRNEILLTPQDDFGTDNAYYVSIPEQPVIRALIIHNDQNIARSKLVPALTAAGDQFTSVEVSYGAPPKVPDLEHDVYVLKDLNTQFVLPGVIADLEEEVRMGKVLVVFAQQGLFALDFNGLLPVRAKPDAEPLSGRHEILVNSSLSLMRGLSDIGQADGSQLLRTAPSENAVVYAQIATNDGPEPVIAAHRLGDGVVIYYGIMDRQQADLDPQSYAILWGRIVDFSLEDPANLNIPTGAVLASQGRIATPNGRREGPLAANSAGFYEADRTTMAANLYPLQAALSISERTAAHLESAIASQFVPELAGQAGAEGGDEAKVPRDLSTLFILAGLAIMLFELFFIKFRGDL